MTSSKGSGVPPPSGKPRRRPAPMIELEATEVENRPVADGAPEAATPKAATEPIASEPVESEPVESAPAAAEPAINEPPKNETPKEEPPLTQEAQSTPAEPPRPEAAAAASAAPATPGPAEASDRPPPRGAIAWLPPGASWPLIGAGVAGGAAVLLALWLANLLPTRDGGAGAADPRLARIERDLRELASRPPPATDRAALDDLAGRITRLETALANPRPVAPDPAVANRLATLEGEVKGMAETVAIVGRRGDENAVAAREARQRADQTATALAELSRRIGELGTSPVTKSELDALAKRVDTVERGEAELAKRIGTDRPLRLAVLAGALAATVERGAPFAGELNAVKVLAPDSKALAPLEPFAASGLPSASTLTSELAVLLPTLAAAVGTPPRDGILDRLQASAERLVRIRPLDDVAGSDPAAIVARIEARAAQADLAGALAELASLPPALRAPAEPWIKKAQARMAALEASRRFAADATAALGK